ncbi:ATP-binding cassette subfamily B protein AbcA/BmrA [Planifilum fimeticola]|jgi:ATP-binding cassette, subfamily B, bacterial AbcA/BmrA|uniref:ATP-binding cassette subfamily B protein AbcA/BmrA n=1 Tax=Planifilum fimeticola TaxID=201975 RepID=A0A2T0LEG7_9BACL|nr:ABC transporter ATP-binding protein [Planifilum fimeticola]PRX40322.1 ATP-binding cassette subfamily B protein AbcA/BmrA [Planifilum fimeticola]
MQERDRQQPGKPFSSFLKLLRLGKPAKGIFAVGILFSLIEAASGLIVPLLTKQLVDAITASGWSLLPVLWLVAAFLLQTVSGGLSHYLMAYIGEGFVRNIREHLWDHILSLPIPYFDKHQSGETMSRITQDTNTVKALISQHIISSLSSIITVLGSVVILFIMDWQMTLILFTAVPLSLLVIMPLGRVMYRISRRTQDEMAFLNANLGRVLGDIRLVKSHNAEDIEKRRGKESIRRLFSFGLKEAKVMAIISPLMTTVMMLVLVILIGYGGVRVASGTLTTGSLIAIILYMFQIIVPFTQLASFFTAFQKAMGATERIQQLLVRSPEADKKGMETLPLDQELVFDRVSFSYEEGKPILREIDFTVKPGETVAIVGPSGGGKTTIFSLIERFYTPDAGQIRLGPLPIDKLDLTAWRRSIGYVSQESPIMSGTIRENICYGLSREAGEDEIRRAAQLANASEFIERLPAGYETEVGERGIKLSGGQRQRIAIARAFLRNPRILLLDEATSNLDSESEMYVQQALKNLMKGRTTLIIAHRLSTVVEADQILVLEEGRITGRGAHEELMATHDLYRRLAKQQLQTARTP